MCPKKPAPTYNENTLVAAEDASEEEAELPEMFFDWQLTTSSKDHENNQTKEYADENIDGIVMEHLALSFNNEHSPRKKLIDEILYPLIKTI